VAIESLHDSVLWNYISTGPESYDHPAETKQIYTLIDEREALKTEMQAAQGTAFCGVSTVIALVVQEGWVCVDDDGGTAHTHVHHVNAGTLSPDKAARLAHVRAELKKLIGVFKKTGYKVRDTARSSDARLRSL